MRLKYRTIRDEQFLTVESIARRIDGLEVDYRGEQGTVIEGSVADFRKIFDSIEDIRDDVWNEMTNGVSNSQATELDNKRMDLRNARNRLQNALSNPDHRWRD